MVGLQQQQQQQQQQQPKNTDKTYHPSPQKIGGGDVFFYLFLGEKIHVFFHDPTTGNCGKSVQVDDRYGVAVVGAVPWVGVSRF